MIAVLRSTLSMLLAVLACALLGAPATAAPTVAPAAAPATTGMADCNELDLDDAVAVRAQADAVTDVFAGEVLKSGARTTVDGGAGKTDEPPRGNVRVTGWEHTVEIEVLFRSALQGNRVTVVTKVAGPGEDGLGRLRTGGTYLFFATGEQGKDHLDAAGCSGTQLLPGGLSADLRDQVHAALEEPVVDEVDYTLTAPDDGARSTPSLGRLAAPGAALALLGVLGLMLLSRIGARRT